jgi:hypothetical protein
MELTLNIVAYFKLDSNSKLLIKLGETPYHLIQVVISFIFNILKKHFNTKFVF